LVTKTLVGTDDVSQSAAVTATRLSFC